jgi:hypothetical protein
MKSPQYLALAVIAALAACARQPGPGETAPARSFPVPAFTRTAVAGGTAWSGHSAEGWTHLRAAQRPDVYLHAGRAYELVQGSLPYNKRTVAPYLLDVTAERSALVHAAFAPDATVVAVPKPGTAVLSTPSGIQRTLDVVFTDGGRTHVLRDYAGPRAIVIFEHECVGCRMEVRELKTLAATVRAKHGVVVVATAAHERRVVEDLAKAGVDAPVVLDRKLSLYALLAVDEVPRGYYLSRTGEIVDTSVGSISEGDVAHFASELAAR